MHLLPQVFFHLLEPGMVSHFLSNRKKEKKKRNITMQVITKIICTLFTCNYALNIGLCLLMTSDNDYSFSHLYCGRGGVIFSCNKHFMILQNSEINRKNKLHIHNYWKMGLNAVTLADTIGI